MGKITHIAIIAPKEGKPFGLIQLDNDKETVVAGKVIDRLLEERRLRANLPNAIEGLIGLELDEEASELTYKQRGEQWGDKPTEVYKESGYRCMKYPKFKGQTNFKRLLLANRANGSADIVDPDDE